MKVRGTLRVPGDKSVSHRALIFAALAEGQSRICHILDSADVRSTAGVLAALGVATPSGPLGEEIAVEGVGLRGLRPPQRDLDCGNSGTTTRLLAGIAAGYPFRSRFVGDASLSRRPMRRIADPLTAMGATVQLSAGDGLPMEVAGGSLHSIEWVNETGSAQVKSAILLAGLVGGVSVTVTASHSSRDHTERFLRAVGADLQLRFLDAVGADGRLLSGEQVRLRPPTTIRPLDLEVPADPSSAAFIAALAALADSGAVRLPAVLLSRQRDGFFRSLVEMGAQVAIESPAETASGETTATYVVGPSAHKGITVGASDVPAMIDELPLLACVAARTDPGEETVVTGAGELRVKESDRIALTVGNLRAIGVDAEELPDGFRLRGHGRKPLRGRVTTRGDHRIAMAFGILGAIPGNAIEVDDPDCVAVSYPRFAADVRRVLA